MSNGTTQNHRITLEKARKMTRTFRDHRGQNIIPGQIGDMIPISETFDRAAIDALLAQPGCVSLRIYYGLDDNMKLHAVMVGVDANGRDILPIDPSVTMMGAAGTTSGPSAATTTSPTDETGIILDEGIRCPPQCPPATDLNGG